MGLRGRPPCGESHGLGSFLARGGRPLVEWAPSVSVMLMTASAALFLETGAVDLPWRRATGNARPLPKVKAKVFAPERSTDKHAAKRVSLVGLPRRCEDPDCDRCETLAAEGKVHIVRDSPPDWGHHESYLVDDIEYRAPYSALRKVFPDDAELNARLEAGVSMGAKIPLSIVRLKDY